MDRNNTMDSDQRKLTIDNTDSRKERLDRQQHSIETSPNTESRGNDNKDSGIDGAATPSMLAGTYNHKDMANDGDSAGNVTPPVGNVQSRAEDLASTGKRKANGNDSNSDEDDENREDQDDQHISSTEPEKSVTQTSPIVEAGSSPSPNNAAKQALRKGVPHVYRDFSNVPDAVGVVRKKTGGVAQPFPEKLHAMLNAEDDASVVSWLPHGRAFLVRKPAEFTDIIMPK
jgi:hypothetical protein